MYDDYCNKGKEKRLRVQRASYSAENHLNKNKICFTAMKKQTNCYTNYNYTNFPSVYEQ